MAQNIRPILRRELGKNRAVAISAVVIAPLLHYRNRNRYCIGKSVRTNPVNDSSGSAIASSKAIPISTGRVNRRDAIMTGRFARGEREKSALDRHFGGRRYGEFARAKRIHDRLGRRQIYPEFPCRISRGPSSDAVIRTTVLSVAGMGGKKKMICDEVIYFIYI